MSTVIVCEGTAVLKPALSTVIVKEKKRNLKGENKRGGGFELEVGEYQEDGGYSTYFQITLFEMNQTVLKRGKALWRLKSIEVEV